MSRIGNKPITVPSGVEVKIDGQTITVKGPKGTLTREFNENVTVTLDNNVITVRRVNDEPANRSLHGLTFVDVGIDGYVFISNRLAAKDEDDSVFLRNVDIFSGS